MEGLTQASARCGGLLLSRDLDEKEVYARAEKQWDSSGRAHDARRCTRVPAQACKIGSVVKIEPATVLAPMAGVTDTVFRRFHQECESCFLSQMLVRMRRMLVRMWSKAWIARPRNQKSGCGLDHDGVYFGGRPVANARVEAEALPDLLR